MTKVKIVLVWMVLAFVARTASAQTIHFVSDPEQLKNVEPLKARHADKELQHVPAGSPVWAVMTADHDVVTIGNFASAHAKTKPGEAGPLHLNVSITNANGGWDDLYAQEITLTPEQTVGDVAMFPIFPDEYDPTAPGLDRLLDRLEMLKRVKQIIVKVNFTTNSPDFHTQDGFIIDTPKGFGRWQAWLDQRGEARRKADEAKLPARSKAVHGFYSMSTDGKVIADAKQWFRAHHQGIELEGAKICSDLIIVKDQLGLPSEKQYCVLYTYKGNHKCWSQMRRLTHRRVGRDTYEKDFIDSTYDNMSIPMGEEKFWGGHEYEVSCK